MSHHFDIAEGGYDLMVEGLTDALLLDLLGLLYDLGAFMRALGLQRNGPMLQRLGESPLLMLGHLRPRPFDYD